MATDWKNHFHAKKWPGGGAETVSGSGSTLEYTAGFRPALENLIKRLKVRTLLDAPCGDFNWMNHVAMNHARYIGLDIIGEVIASNASKYARADREFRVSDITSDPLPRADLMICRDCTFHLPFSYIWKLLANFSRSGIPHLLLTTHVQAENVDLPQPGGYKRRNFLAPPFSFPRPSSENWLADYPAHLAPKKGERYMGLWSAAEITAVLKRAKKDGRLPIEAGTIGLPARSGLLGKIRHRLSRFRGTAAG